MSSFKGEEILGLLLDLLLRYPSFFLFLLHFSFSFSLSFPTDSSTSFLSSQCLPSIFCGNDNDTKHFQGEEDFCLRVRGPEDISQESSLSLIWKVTKEGGACVPFDLSMLEEEEEEEEEDGGGEEKDEVEKALEGPRWLEVDFPRDLETALRFIERAEEKIRQNQENGEGKGGRILVHCPYGMFTSPGVLVAFFITRKGR
jgi:hypothetical protein